MSAITEKDGKFNPPEEMSKKAHISSMEQYKQMYQRSIDDPEGFWAEVADDFFWYKKWDKVREYDYVGDGEQGIQIKWFQGAKTNITVNCLDRHLDTWRKNKAAIIWEGNEPTETKTYTYAQLHREVNKFANVLKAKNVKKGDRVAIYMPMIPELAIAMLACARIGAMHSIVFGGFSPDALADRIEDATCKVVITADGTYRGKKPVPLKANTDAAMNICEKRDKPVETCIVVNRANLNITMKAGRDEWWHEVMEGMDDYCEPEVMDAEDPLFILYTSGSTGKPKGVLHTTGGYMVYTGTTFKYIFDYQDQDTYWCTADIGWVTGHSYIVYGPLSQGATSIMFEGVPTYPGPDRFWEVVQKYKVNSFYTAPTAIRAVMRFGDEHPKKWKLDSLKVLGTVGEPINPEAWKWYHEVIGGEKCPIVDTWWQTETGGVLITPLPGATPTKPGSATLPFFGVKPAILDDQGKELEGETSGALVIKEPWPGQMRTIFGDHKRFKETYFSMFKGVYFTGDGCKRDADGYYWITGRIDDVINVSGHRMGTAEVESALVSHAAVAEAAVVGYPHEIKGQGIYAYVTLIEGREYTDDLKKELRGHVRTEIGPIATPDVIHWAPGLPKTRSGKIMRRILRKIAANEFDSLGDTSTLADPAVVDNLVETRKDL